MKTWTIIIGEIEDFRSVAEMQGHVEGHAREPGMLTQAASFDAPEDLDDLFVTLIGRGLAFELGYSAHDSISYIVSGRVKMGNGRDSVYMTLPGPRLRDEIYEKN